jgi:hypothetical protein
VTMPSKILDAKFNKDSGAEPDLEKAPAP